MEILNIVNVQHKPKIEGAIFQPFIYGQVGTKIITEILFTSSIETIAVVLNWGFAKNSEDIFIPGTNEIYSDYFENLISGAKQSYSGGIGSLNFMNPISALDGEAVFAVHDAEYPAWSLTTDYLEGDHVSYLGIDYTAIADSSNKKPSTYPLFWTPVFSFSVLHEWIIQPLASINDFDSAGTYTKNEYLQNSESVKYVYQIDLKTSPQSPLVVASSKDADPLINLGAVGFIDEKLNGNPLDCELSLLEINDNDSDLEVFEGENTVSFSITSDTHTLTLDDSNVQIIAYKLNYDLDTNIKLLEQIDFSSATNNESDNLIQNVIITDNFNILEISFDFLGTLDDEIVLYANISPKNDQLTEQTFLIFQGVVEATVIEDAYRTKTPYNQIIDGIIFFHEYSGINSNYAFSNVAAFVDDILLSLVNIEKVNSLAVLNSVEVSLINDSAEVLQSSSYEASELSVTDPTSYSINDVNRENIDISLFTSGTIEVVYPFRIKSAWTGKTGIRLTYNIYYTLNGIDYVTTIKSAPFRLGGYDSTKNTDTEPQALPSFSEKIKILSEDGTINMNQFNTAQIQRLRTEFADKNELTDNLQVSESELCGYYAISLPNSPDLYHYITSEFGALGISFFKSIDGSFEPECKLTLIDEKTAMVEAVVDVDDMRDLLGDSDSYDIICRIDKLEQSLNSINQYSFIFNQNSIQKYEHILTSDLLKNATLSVYYSQNYPNVIKFTHVLSGFYASNFEDFKAYVNGNAAISDVMTVEWTAYTNDIYESIVKINIPSNDNIPSGSYSIANTFTGNYAEQDVILAIDGNVSISLSSSYSNPDFKYAIREVGGELTEFEDYNITNLNNDLAAANSPKLLHIWSARPGDSIDTIYASINIESGNKNKLVTVNNYSQNENASRGLWNENSLICSNQWLVVGDATIPYQQLECRDSFTFYAVFYKDSTSESREQIFTTNSRDSANANPFLSFNIANRKFNVSFTAVDGTTIKTLTFSGIGIKAGYNFVVGRWDATTESNRYIFVNGYFQNGETANENGFDLLTDTVVNLYDDAIFLCNDYDTSASEFFTGKLFDFKLSNEQLQDKESVFREYFLKGVIPFESSELILQSTFNRSNGDVPIINTYPVTTKIATTYEQFNP